MPEMPELKFKKACNDCPFRRNSTVGWLGSGSWTNQQTTNEQCAHFVDGALADYADKDGAPLDLPCHETIDYGDPDWMTNQYPQAALCVGALIFARNQAKSPRDPRRARYVRAVESDGNIFRYPWEFYEHHGGELPSPMRVMRDRIAGHERSPA